MKKLILFVTSLFLVTIIFAQHKPGTIQLRFGPAAGLYVTQKTSVLTLGAISFTDIDSSANLTNIIPIEFFIGVDNRLSFGASFSFGNYIEDSLQAQTRQNKIHSFGLTSDFYFVNKARFNMFLNAGFYFTSLKMFDERPLGLHKQTFSGFGPSFKLGSNIMFLEFLGLNIQLGYDGRNLHLREWLFNENQQDLSNLSAKLNSKGIQLGLGLCLAF